MRASDTIEKITREHPEWLNPYKNKFLNVIAKIEQKEVRWHSAQILPRLDLTKKEQDKVFYLMLTYLEKTGVPSQQSRARKLLILLEKHKKT